VLGEEAEAALARLELAGLAGALGVVAAEHDGQHRAGHSHKGPALERGDRDECHGIADESAENAIAQADPEDRGNDIPEHDGPGRQLG
jgi:hypothetical protein